MHANARRRSFWARALGPGGHLGLQRLVVLFEKSRVGSKPTKSFRGFFWTLGQGPRRRLSSPERVPWSARTGEERQSRSFSQLPVLQFIIAAFSVHLMRNNNNDLNSNKRFNNFTNRLT